MSSELNLKIASFDYDRIRALAKGDVRIDDVDIHYSTAKVVTEVFEGMIRGREFDVSELGMTYYLRTLDLENPPFVALPVFSRAYLPALRHLCQ